MEPRNLSACTVVYRLLVILVYRLVSAPTVYLANHEATADTEPHSFFESFFLNSGRPRPRPRRWSSLVMRVLDRACYFEDREYLREFGGWELPPSAFLSPRWPFNDVFPLVQISG